MKKYSRSIKALVACFCWIATPLMAESILVKVECNGRFLPNLPISVFDSSQAQPLPGISITDSEGAFVIENSELFMPPFFFFFTAKNGSSCGSYPVNLIDPSEGRVELFYYPTNVPCSCSLDI